MDSVPPAHGPARHLDDLLTGLAAEGADGVDGGEEPDEGGSHPELPEVVEAVTGRARDLHRLADRLSADPAADGAGGPLSAVALLRAHAGAVDDLAEHLLVAGAERAAPDTAAAPAVETEPGPAGTAPRGPRGAPRSVG
jgi:hypothetical protein